MIKSFARGGIRAMVRVVRRGAVVAATAGVVAAGVAAALCHPAAAVPREGEPAQADVVAAIQARLAELGYYRGRPDGIVGQMTREAIRRYERHVGIEPTGAPSLDIYRRLREAAGPQAAREPAPDPAPESAPETPGERSATGEPFEGVAAAGTRTASVSMTLPVAGAARRDAPPPVEPAAAVTVSGADWRFRDEGGAVFTVALRPDGTVGGFPFSESWTWTQDGDSVELTYANRLGRTATRRGTLLSADSMAGSGRSSAGAAWTWTAARQP